MVADLVHQHVGDDGAQAVLVLGPVVEDRPAVEPDHVGHLLQNTGRLKGRPTPWNRPSRSNSLSISMDFQHLVGGEILDPDDEALAQAAEALRQAGIGLRRQRLDIGQRGRRHPPPGLRTVNCLSVPVFYVERLAYTQAFDGNGRDRRPFAMDDGRLGT